MNFCSNCGNQLAPSSKFCSKCGAPVAAAPVPVEPVYVAPAPVEPVYAAPAEPVYAEPAPVVEPVAAPVYARPQAPAQQNMTKKTKIFGFVGMGTGIGGLALAAIGALYTLVAMFDDGAFAFGLSIGFAMFSVPLSIAGMMLSNQSKEAGNESKVCTIGSIMGLVGVIGSGVMAFLGFIGLLIGL